MSTSILAAVGSGGIVGFMLSLLGGGGSILATPLLLYVVGVSQPHIAIGTGALAVSVNAFANFASHAIKGHVWWRCTAVFSALGVLGALAGSSLGKAMDGNRLIFLFGVLMVVVGALMLKPRKAVTAECRQSTSRCVSPRRFLRNRRRPPDRSRPDAGDRHAVDQSDRDISALRRCVRTSDSVELC